MYKVYRTYLNTLLDSGKYRRLAACRQHQCLDFSTNDYLNLSKHPMVIAAVNHAAHHHGVGATGSRLLSGNNPIFTEFEALIAADKHTQASLIYSCGFQANANTLACLLDVKVLQQQALVFFDKLNHASLYQAIFLSNPELHRYHHNDCNHLEFLLRKYQHDQRPKFIVTETLFGMDGDIAPLNEIADLARQHQAFLYLDEAHATGLFGLNGYGLATTINLQDIPHIIMGTFSKALGASGGYIACDELIKNYIINKSPGFIYSTAPSPAIINGALQAWRMVKSLHNARKRVQYLGNQLREKLNAQGFNTGTSATHIVPIILQDERLCLNVQQALMNTGVLVSVIRPPTVPPGSARLRLAINAQHAEHDMQHFVNTLLQVIK